MNIERAEKYLLLRMQEDKVFVEKEKIKHRQGDPVVQYSSGWYFIDDFFLLSFGPFKTEEEATEFYSDYDIDDKRIEGLIEIYDLG